jgi:spore maturation protein SpmB
MFAAVCAFLSVWALPLVLLLIPLAGFLRRVRIYEAFVEGAAEGFQTAVRIMPFLVAMLWTTAWLSYGRCYRSPACRRNLCRWP